MGKTTTSRKASRALDELLRCDQAADAGDDLPPVLVPTYADPRAPRHPSSRKSIEDFVGEVVSAAATLPNGPLLTIARAVNREAQARGLSHQLDEPAAKGA